MPGKRLESDTEITELLRTIRKVAVVGLSPDPDRDSYRVAALMQREGYTIVPVHPRGGTILGETVHASLTDAVRAEAPDLVDVFRRPDAVPAIVAEAIACGAPRLWLQLGITHPEAEAEALAAGIDLVVDRCMAVEIRRLLSRS